MPLVRHTPPCKLSRPSRVPSDVARREEPEGEVGTPEGSLPHAPAPTPPEAVRGLRGSNGPLPHLLWILGAPPHSTLPSAQQYQLCSNHGVSGTHGPRG